MVAAMARYLIQVPRDVLAEDRKAEIAKTIAAAHNDITGDKSSSVRVAIVEIDAGCFFAGGSLIECNHIFVHGYVAGATAERKQALIARLSADVTKAADFEPDSTWTTISEI
jgi:phenylpyruvate tautomerase PptA (4-oxalocrotonate tautomerase family)